MENQIRVAMKGRWWSKAKKVWCPRSRALGMWGKLYLPERSSEAHSLVNFNLSLLKKRDLHAKVIFLDHFKMNGISMIHLAFYLKPPTIKKVHKELDPLLRSGHSCCNLINQQRLETAFFFFMQSRCCRVCTPAGTLQHPQSTQPVQCQRAGLWQGPGK